MGVTIVGWVAVVARNQDDGRYPPALGVRRLVMAYMLTISTSVCR